jgi:hypothetical protein
MSEPIIAETPLTKRLAVFLDGTWNVVDDNTNVWRLKSLISSRSGDNSEQMVYYEIGVNVRMMRYSYLDSAAAHTPHEAWPGLFLSVGSYSRARLLA